MTNVQFERSDDVCNIIAPLLAVQSHGGLSFAEDQQVQQHLQKCFRCRETMHVYSLLKDPLQQTVEAYRSFTPSPDAILHAIHNRSGNKTMLREQLRRNFVLKQVWVWVATVMVVVSVGLLAVSHSIYQTQNNTGTSVISVGGAAIPVPLFSSEYSLSMVSSQEGWAVGAQPNLEPLVFHFHDSHWQQVSLDLPHSDLILTGIAMRSEMDGWIVGGIPDSPSHHGKQAILLHYDGVAWHIVPTPIQDTLIGIQVVGKNSVWVICADSTCGNMGAPVLSFDGTTWQSLPLPATLPLPFYPRSFSMTSQNEGWLAGVMPGKDGILTGGIFHLSNGRWQLQQVLQDTLLSSISMANPTRGWCVGSVRWKDSQGNAHFRFVLAEYRDGHWQQNQVPSNTDMQGINTVKVITDQDVWLFGYSEITATKSVIAPLIVHYDGATWKTELTPQMPGFGKLDIVSLAVLQNGEVWSIANGERIPATKLNNEVPLIFHKTSGDWQSLQQ